MKTEAHLPKKSYNILPKVLCIVAAVILWLYVMQMDAVDATETFSGVTVELTGTSEIESESGLYVYSGYGTLVDVSVTGRKSVISGYSADDIKVVADLSAIDSAGEYHVNLKAKLPNGLALSSLSVDTATVYVDEKDTKTVTVKATVIGGTVAENYELGELEPKYDTINVTGPKIVLDDIDYAKIELSLGNIETSLTTTGQIELVSISGETLDTRYLKLSRNEMDVTVPLYTYKELSLEVATKYGYLDSTNSKITVTPEKVLARGDVQALADTDSFVITTLDEKKLTGDSMQIVSLTPPDGIVIADGTESAAVKVEHIGTVTKSYTVSKFDVTGSNGINYSIETPSITVTLRGTLADLVAIKDTDITAGVDLSPYTSGVAGTITQPVTIKLNAEKVYELGEYTVQVTIG